MDVLKSAGTWQQSSVTDNKEDVDTAELDADYHGAPECGVKKENVCKGNEERGLSDGSDKKTNTIALNAVRVLSIF